MGWCLLLGLADVLGLFAGGFVCFGVFLCFVGWVWFVFGVGC